RLLLWRGNVLRLDRLRAVVDLGAVVLTEDEGLTGRHVDGLPGADAVPLALDVESDRRGGGVLDACHVPVLLGSWAVRGPGLGRPSRGGPPEAHGHGVGVPTWNTTTPRESTTPSACSVVPTTRVRRARASRSTSVLGCFWNALMRNLSTTAARIGRPSSPSGRTPSSTGRKRIP